MLFAEQRLVNTREGAERVCEACPIDSRFRDALASTCERRRSKRVQLSEFGQKGFAQPNAQEAFLSPPHHHSLLCQTLLRGLRKYTAGHITN